MNSVDDRVIDKKVLETLDELFDTTKLFERVHLPGGQTQGRVLPSVLKDRLIQMPKRTKPNLGQDQAYALKYQKQEDAFMEAASVHRRERWQTNEIDMEALSSIPSTVSDYKPEVMDEFAAARNMSVYNRYNFLHEPASNLPIAEYKNQIVNMVEAYHTVVIQGHTGCGKSTQVPQFILDDQRDKKRPCNIVVTQPRRLAAVSLAKRVSLERKWPLGRIVGYKIGQHSEVSQDTRICYCTTGVLLQILVNAKNMNKFTHVIIDEVHERGQELDFLILLVRKFLRTNSRHVKVILMSATFNSEKFAQYFSTQMFKEKCASPIISILQEKRYEVFEYYLDDMRHYNTEIESDFKHIQVTNNHHRLAVKIIKSFDDMDNAEYEMKLERGVKDAKLCRGAVLVFLPGIFEIEDLYEKLYRERREYKWTILPLHSTITTEEQAAVFNPCQEGYRKIILSTNIAESSITVPDTIYVIDYCMAKQLVKDELSNFTTLELTWASKSNCIQRAGRVGRVAIGKVYRLLSKRHYNSLINEQVPEMLRCPLTRVVLMAKILDSSPPKQLLALALEPPDLNNIQDTVLQLKETGAILRTVKGEYNEEDGDLTFLGQVMARLPVDICVAKLIIFGYLFSVADSCIIIGAAMSVKNMFATRFRDQMNSYLSRLVWSDSSNSDPIAFLNAYKLWCYRKETGYFERMRTSNPTANEKAWAEKFNISYRSLQEICDLILEIKERLKSIGFPEIVGRDRVVWSTNEEPLILKILLAGAFFPNYFVRGNRGGQVSEENAVKTLVGRDPYSSVYLTNFDQRYPGHVYTQAVKDLLKDCAPNMKVQFEHSSKIYVEFPKDEECTAERDMPYKLQLPGRVSLSVYKAIKLRHLGVQLPLKLPDESTLEEEEQQPFRGFSPADAMMEGFCPWPGSNRAGPSTTPSHVPSFSTRLKSLLPPMDISHMEVIVTHVCNAGRFWVQDASKDAQDMLAKIFYLLNRNHPDDLYPVSTMPRVDHILVAPYDNQLFRAKVTSVKQDHVKGILVSVLFIDYGNTATLSISELREFGAPVRYKGIHMMPAIAVDCVLAEVAPSTLRSHNGQWCEEANQFIRETILDKTLYCYVYSVVNSVMSVRLLKNNADNQTTINEELLELGFAQATEESFLSQKSHESRENACNLNTEMKEMLEAAQQHHSGEDLETHFLPHPDNSSATRVIYLKGPYSPLEMKLHHMLYCSKANEVAIEGLSVNSVLLDDNPQDKYDRMIVAGCVQTTSRGALILRQTTILPNLPGLPALLCLIFSPVVELRTNDDFTKLTGIICGLGFHAKSRSPIYEDHDIELAFDTKIDLEDIDNVNQLRNWMNKALCLELGETYAKHSMEEIRNYQLNIRHYLAELLKKKREWQEPVANLNDQLWSLIPESRILVPKLNKKDNDIFQLINGIEIEKEGAKQKREIIANLKVLRDMVSNSRKHPVHNARCIMCKFDLYSATQLRLHLSDPIHLSLEEGLMNELSD